jgi:hypothetical protein
MLYGKNGYYIVDIGCTVKFRALLVFAIAPCEVQGGKRREGVNMFIGIHCPFILLYITLL